MTKKIIWGKIHWNILQSFYLSKFYFCNKANPQKTKNVHYFLLAPYKGIELADAVAAAFLGISARIALGKPGACVLVFCVPLRGDSPQQFMYEMSAFLPNKGIFHIVATKGWYCADFFLCLPMES